MLNNDKITNSPSRFIPGVGSGIENKVFVKDFDRNNIGRAEKAFENSPCQRIPLGTVSDNSRSALLSGVQRVLVRTKSANEHTHTITPVRSPNNFMKPTEASR